MNTNAGKKRKKNLKKGEEVLLTKGITIKTNGHVLEYFEISSLPEFYRFRSVSRL